MPPPSQIFLPNDYIVRKGDKGDCMFFIRKGLVDVGLAEEGVVFKTLEPGSYFGEIAVLTNDVRSADCVAKTFVDVFTLSRHDVDLAIADFPAVARQLKAVARARIEEDRQRNGMCWRRPVFRGIKGRGVRGWWLVGWLVGWVGDAVGMRSVGKMEVGVSERSTLFNEQRTKETHGQCMMGDG